jgi:streptomycin 3"-adenylyltransferase
MHHRVRVPGSLSPVAETAVDNLIAPILDHVTRDDPGQVIGIYLYGSAVTSGLRPSSDIDLLLLNHRSLTAFERRGLVSLLLEISGRTGHASRFPNAHGRPIELTSMVLGDIQPWSDRPLRDFQYGEWLRADLVAGHLPQPTVDPDAVVILATAQTAHRTLRGPAFARVVVPVPPRLLCRSVRAVIPDLLEHIEGDERNVLLTLARVLITLETGRIVSKDAAAAAIAPTLAGTDRDLLESARAGYLGLDADDWIGLVSEASALAYSLAARAVPSLHQGSDRAPTDQS